jgi:membrane protease YdiL (CAAX protease family)
MPFVWIAISAVIGFITFGALFAIVNPPGIEGEQHQIHLALSRAQSEWGLLPSGPGKQQASKIIRELGATPVKSPAAKGTLGRALLILRQQTSPTATPDFANLNDEKGKSADALTPGAKSSKEIKVVNDTLRELYSARKLSTEQARELTERLGRFGARWPMDIAAMHALELTDTAQDVTGRKAVVVVVAGALFLGGIISLLLILVKPKPMGLPISGAPGLGDALGARFLLFLGTFIIAGAVAGGLVAAKIVTESAALLFIEVLLIFCVLLILALPIGGKRITPGELGLRSNHLLADVGYGLLGFLANLPVIAGLAWFGIQFLRWIPSGGHPIENQLLEASNLPLLVLTAGPITAILEELTFRGLLFQGLAQRFRIWPAIILSSLGFAMVHPQGGALWLALAWVGGMAAYLTYQRKSLIPAMVMHACHNTALILLAAYAAGAK